MEVQVTLALEVGLALHEVGLALMHREHLAQPGDLLGGHVLGRQAGGHALQGLTHVEQLEQLLHGELYHPGADVGHPLDQAVRLEAAHRLAQRSTGDAIGA